MTQERLWVWVLAASTGGIEAVARFLKGVPRRDGVALVYVQHLFEQQHRHLLKIVERNSDWRVSGVDYGARLRGGTVVIPSAGERFDIDGEGIIGLGSGDGWPPPYSPNIDDIATQVARCYRERSGMIVFSGMGSDGSLGAGKIEAGGGRVWIQSPEECAAVAMPRAAIAATTAVVVAPVSELIARFTDSVLKTSVREIR